MQKFEKEKSRMELNEEMIKLATGGDVEGVKNLLLKGISGDFVKETKQHYSSFSVSYNSTMGSGCGSECDYFSEKSALTEAIKRGHQLVVEALLSSKIDINRSYRYFWPELGSPGAPPFIHIETPLTIAITQKRENIASLLLQHGADPNAVAKHERQALIHRGKYVDKPAIHLAIEYELSLKFIQLLLEKGADPSKKGHHRRSKVKQVGLGFFGAWAFFAGSTSKFFSYQHITAYEAARLKKRRDVVDLLEKQKNKEKIVQSDEFNSNEKNNNPSSLSFS